MKYSWIAGCIGYVVFEVYNVMQYVSLLEETY